MWLQGAVRKSSQCPQIPWNDISSLSLTTSDGSQKWANDVLRQMVSAHKRSFEKEETINSITVFTIEKLVESAREKNISKQGKKGIHYSIRAIMNCRHKLKLQEKKIFCNSFNPNYNKRRVLRHYFDRGQHFIKCGIWPF